MCSRASGKRTWNYDYNRCEPTNIAAFSHVSGRKIGFAQLVHDTPGAPDLARNSQ